MKKFRGGRKKTRQYRNRTKRAARVVRAFYRSYPHLRCTGSDAPPLCFMSEGEKEAFWQREAKRRGVSAWQLQLPNRIPMPLIYHGAAVTGRFSTTKVNAQRVLRNVEKPYRVIIRDEVAIVLPRGP